MALVTLKKYLSETGIDLKQILGQIFKGIVSTAVRADEEDYRDLKATIDRISSGVETASTGPEVLVSTGAAIQALDSYNQNATRMIRRQGAELQKMIAMLTECVVTISGSSARSIEALGGIKSTLHAASGLEDLQELKSKLGRCLEQICEEVTRRREETEASVTALEKHIHSAELRVRQAGGSDYVTNLPTRSAAENALLKAAETPGRNYAAVVVLDRLQSINSRFGNSVGDEVLAELARQLQADIGPGETLFRWTGPAIVMLSPRSAPIDRVRTELRPILARTMEREFNVGGRDVLISVSPAWTVFGVIAPVATIVKQIDTFVSSQAPKDFL